MAPKHTPKHNSWGLNGTNYWRLFIVEYLQPGKFKDKPGFNPIYWVSCFSSLGDASCFHVFPRKGRLSLSAQWKKIMFLGKNTIFPDNTRKIMCWCGPFWKDHLFRGTEENIIFPCIFKERSSFIFRLRCKIIFSGKGNIIFLDNTRKIMFRRNFFGKTIFSGRPEKENMVFRAVQILAVSILFIIIFKLYLPLVYKNSFR